MDFILDNWYIIVSFFAMGAAAGVAVYHFAKKPTEAQLAKVREWLIWAVTEAERTLGSGTGQLKLRWVYDRFVSRFPWLAKIISFEMFSGMVDDALAEVRHMLQTNDAVEYYVENK